MLDVGLIHRVLTTSYWAEGIPMDIVRRSIENSICFGLYESGKQIGFARATTDAATFAYIADVFIVAEKRGNGFSKFLMQGLLEHPQLQGLRRILLATKDAHSLYEKSGFKIISNPERWMHVYNPEVYGKGKKTC